MKYNFPVTYTSICGETPIQNSKRYVQTCSLNEICNRRGCVNGGGHGSLHVLVDKDITYQSVNVPHSGGNSGDLIQLNVKFPTMWQT